jgi:hypothetical protein
MLSLEGSADLVEDPIPQSVIARAEHGRSHTR